MDEPNETGDEDEHREADAPPATGQPPHLPMYQSLTPRAPFVPGAGARVVPLPLGPVPGGSAPATWAPDPTGRHQWRWWSGVGWTDHVADDGEAAEDPVDTA